jgi:hypothetical protein
MALISRFGELPAREKVLAARGGLARLRPPNRGCYRPASGLRALAASGPETAAQRPERTWHRGGIATKPGGPPLGASSEPCATSPSVITPTWQPDKSVNDMNVTFMSLSQHGCHIHVVCEEDPQARCVRGGADGADGMSGMVGGMGLERERRAGAGAGAEGGSGSGGRVRCARGGGGRSRRSRLSPVAWRRPGRGRLRRSPRSACARPRRAGGRCRRRCPGRGLRPARRCRA